MHDVPSLFAARSLAYLSSGRGVCDHAFRSSDSHCGYVRALTSRPIPEAVIGSANEAVRFEGRAYCTHLGTLSAPSHRESGKHKTTCYEANGLTFGAAAVAAQSPGVWRRALRIADKDFHFSDELSASRKTPGIWA